MRSVQPKCTVSSTRSLSSWRAGEPGSDSVAWRGCREASGLWGPAGCSSHAPGSANECCSPRPGGPQGSACCSSLGKVTEELSVWWGGGRILEAGTILPASLLCGPPRNPWAADPGGKWRAGTLGRAWSLPSLSALEHTKTTSLLLVLIAVWRLCIGSGGFLREEWGLVR